MKKCGHNKPCAICGKPFWVTPSQLARYNRQFCSVACKSKAATDRGNPHYYKENAWKVFERKCYDCGYDEHPEIVIIHHIDGNRRNGKIENLVPLCQNCHAVRHLEMAKSGIDTRPMYYPGGPSVRHVRHLEAA